MGDLPISVFDPNGTQQTTKIGFGGAVINWDSYKTGVHLVKEALASGFRYFDTSPGYCGGESQAIFGEGLEGAGDDVMIATKVGYFEDPGDFTNPDAIRKQIDHSLGLLKRDRVDLLQVHEANWECWWRKGAGRTQIDPHADFAFNEAPILQVLREAKEQGLCKRIGITGNVADQMSHILDNVTVDTILIAFNYDLIRRGADIRAVPLALEKNVAVIIGAIFNMGRMAIPHPEWLNDPPDWMTPVLKDRFTSLYTLQRESGYSLVELSVRFSLQHPDASVVLVGVKNGVELTESLRAAEAGPLPGDLHEKILQLGLKEY